MVLDSGDDDQQKYVEIRRKLRHELSYEIYLKAGSLFPPPLHQNVNAISPRLDDAPDDIRTAF